MTAPKAPHPYMRLLCHLDQLKLRAIESQFTRHQVIECLSHMSMKQRSGGANLKTSSICQLHLKENNVSRILHLLTLGKPSSDACYVATIGNSLHFTTRPRFGMNESAIGSGNQRSSRRFKCPENTQHPIKQIHRSDFRNAS